MDEMKWNENKEKTSSMMLCKRGKNKFLSLSVIDSHMVDRWQISLWKRPRRFSSSLQVEEREREKRKDKNFFFFHPQNIWSKQKYFVLMKCWKTGDNNVECNEWKKIKNFCWINKKYEIHKIKFSSSSSSFSSIIWTRVIEIKRTVTNNWIYENERKKKFTSNNYSGHICSTRKTNQWGILYDSLVVCLLFAAVCHHHHHQNMGQVNKNMGKKEYFFHWKKKQNKNKNLLLNAKFKHTHTLLT